MKRFAVCLAIVLCFPSTASAALVALKVDRTARWQTHQRLEPGQSVHVVAVRVGHKPLLFGDVYGCRGAMYGHGVAIRFVACPHRPFTITAASFAVRVVAIRYRIRATLGRWDHQPSRGGEHVALGVGESVVGHRVGIVP